MYVRQVHWSIRLVSLHFDSAVDEKTAYVRMWPACKPLVAKPWSFGLILPVDVIYPFTYQRDTS